MGKTINLKSRKDELKYIDNRMDRQQLQLK